MSESMGGVLNSQSSDLEVIGLSQGGLSFEAISYTPDGQEEIVGTILCTLHKNGQENPIYKKVFKIPMDEKFKKICEITDHAKDLANIYDQYQVDEYLEGVIISVKPSHSGRGIARKLIEAVEEHSKEKGFKLIYVGCSSEFTAKVMIRMGYQQVVAVPYEEYRKGGQQVFKVKPPHVAYKGFIKVLQE